MLPAISHSLCAPSLTFEGLSLSLFPFPRYFALHDLIAGKGKYITVLKLLIIYIISHTQARSEVRRKVLIDYINPNTLFYHVHGDEKQM